MLDIDDELPEADPNRNTRLFRARAGGSRQKVWILGKVHGRRRNLLRRRPLHLPIPLGRRIKPRACARGCTSVTRKGCPTTTTASGSMPCLGDLCTLPHTDKDPRKKYYFPSLVLSTGPNPLTGKFEWEKAVLELTDTAAAELPRVDYIGAQIEVYRAGKKDNAPIRIAMLPRPTGPTPASFSVMPVLNRIFKIGELERLARKQEPGTILEFRREETA